MQTVSPFPSTAGSGRTGTTERRLNEIRAERRNRRIRIDTVTQDGISDQTIDIWRKRFGTLQADDVKRLRGLEQENARLKKMARSGIRPSR